MKRNEIETWFDMAFDYLIEGDFASACECFEYIINFSKDAYASNIARRDMEWWCFPVKALVERLKQTPHPVTLEELLKELKLDKHGGQAKQYVDNMGDALKKISIVYLIGDNLWVYTDHLKQSLQRTFAQMFQDHEPTTLVELTNHLFVEHGYQLPLKLHVINSVKSFLGNMPEVVLLESGCVFSVPILQSFIAILIEQIRATQQPALLSDILQRVPWPQSVVKNLQIPQLSTWLRINTNSELIEIAPEFWFLDDLIDLATIDVTPIFTNLYHPVETVDIIRHYFFPGNNNLETNEEFLNLQTERVTKNPYLKQIGRNSWISKQGYQALINELLTGLAQSERPQTIEELLLVLKETHSLTEDLQDRLVVTFAKELEQSTDVIRISESAWLHKKTFPSILDRAHEFLSERGPSSIENLIKECLTTTMKGIPISTEFYQEFQDELEQDDRFIVAYEGGYWLAIPLGNRVNNLAYEILYRKRCPLSTSELIEESRRRQGRAVHFQLVDDKRFKQASDGRWMLGNWILINDLAASYLAKEKIGLIAREVLQKTCEVNDIPVADAIFDPTADLRFKKDPWGRWHCESAGKILTPEMLDTLVKVATYDLEWGVQLERLIQRAFKEPSTNFFNLDQRMLEDGRLIYCEGLWYPKEKCLQQVAPDQAKKIKDYLEEKKYPISGYELAKACLGKPICLTNLEEVLASDSGVVKIGGVGWVLKADQPESLGHRRLNNFPIRSGKYIPSVNPEQLTESEVTPPYSGETVGNSKTGKGLRRRPHHLTVTLTYEDLRDGTIVITSAMRSFLDSSVELPILKFTDELRNDYVCWCDLTHELLYGLRDWFKMRGLQFGDKIRFGLKEHEGEFSIELTGQHSEQIYRESLRRSQVEDWRQEAMRSNRSYQDLTLEIFDFFKTPLHIDDIWSLVDYKRTARKSTISAILSTHPFFVSIGEGYWRFDEQEYTRMISKLEEQVQKLQRENQRLENQIELLMQSTSQSKELQEQIDHLQKALAGTQEAEQQARKMQIHFQGQCDDLKSQLAQRDSELALLKTELAAQRDQTQQMNIEFDTIRSELPRLRERLTAQGQESEELRNSLEQARGELSMVRASVETAETLRAQAEDSQQRLKTLLDRAQANIITLNGELKQRQKELGDQEHANRELSLKVETLEAKCEQVKQSNQDYETRNIELEAKLEQIKAELGQFRIRNAQLETELTQTSHKADNLEQVVTELNDKYVVVDQNYTQAMCEVESLKSRIQVISETNAQLRDHKTQMETELEDHIKEMNILEEKVRGLQGKLTKEQQEKETLSNRIDQLRRAHDALRAEHIEDVRILGSIIGRLARWWDGVKGNQTKKKPPFTSLSG